MPHPAPKFEHPPIVELVLGVQFAPLHLTTAHLGLFWKQYLGKGWPRVTEVPPLPEQREVFADHPVWGVATIQVSTMPTHLRLQITNEAGDRMIQAQNTRFHYNWQKKEGVYPSYKDVRGEFDQMFDLFQKFVNDEGLGAIRPNQWEITYIDFVPPGGLWQSPADWGKVLPGLLSKEPAPEGLKLENPSSEWHYEITPRRGRLHVNLALGKIEGASEGGLLLQTTGRGPIDKDTSPDLGSGLDLGHDMIIQAFMHFTSDEAQRAWGRRE
jgi:uncharacterized protein (TIGR04255 family)